MTLSNVQPIVPAVTRVFDHTALAALARCEEEFYRRHGQHLRHPREGAAFRIGRAIHAGVRAFYAGATGATMIKAVTEAYGTSIAEDFRTQELAQRYVQMYAQVYPCSAWGFEVLHNEGYLESEMDAGIPDRIVRRVSDGQVYPLELKTTALWPSIAWQEQWAHSSQAAIQMDLAEERYGHAVAGFWLDGVYLSSRKAGPIAADFYRVGPFTYSPALRAELRVLRRKRQKRAAELVEGTGAPPEKQEHNCMRYNHICDFFRFCRADPADRADMYRLAVATGELEVQPWKPSERSN